MVTVSTPHLLELFKKERVNSHAIRKQVVDKLNEQGKVHREECKALLMQLVEPIQRDHPQWAMNAALDQCLDAKQVGPLCAFSAQYATEQWLKTNVEDLFQGGVTMAEMESAFKGDVSGLEKRLVAQQDPPPSNLNQCKQRLAQLDALLGPPNQKHEISGEDCFLVPAIHARLRQGGSIFGGYRMKPYLTIGLSVGMSSAVNSMCRNLQQPLCSSYSCVEYDARRCLNDVQSTLRDLPWNVNAFDLKCAESNLNSALMFKSSSPPQESRSSSDWWKPIQTGLSAVVLGVASLLGPDTAQAAAAPTTPVPVAAATTTTATATMPQVSTLVQERAKHYFDRTFGVLSSAPDIKPPPFLSPQQQQQPSPIWILNQCEKTKSAHLAAVCQQQREQARLDRLAETRRLQEEKRKQEEDERKKRQEEEERQQRLEEEERQKRKEEERQRQLEEKKQRQEEERKHQEAVRLGKKFIQEYEQNKAKKQREEKECARRRRRQEIYIQKSLDSINEDKAFEDELEQKVFNREQYAVKKQREFKEKQLQEIEERLAQSSQSKPQSWWAQRSDQITFGEIPEEKKEKQMPRTPIWIQEPPRQLQRPPYGPMSYDEDIYTYWRGDGRPPNKIRNSGFEPMGHIHDLWKHCKFCNDSGFVATSKKAAVAKLFAQHNARYGASAWVYRIESKREILSPKEVAEIRHVDLPKGQYAKRGPVDVNHIMGDGYPHWYQREFAFLGGVLPEEIKEAFELYGDEYLSYWPDMESGPALLPKSKWITGLQWIGRALTVYDATMDALQWKKAFDESLQIGNPNIVYRESARVTAAWTLAYTNALASASVMLEICPKICPKHPLAQALCIGVGTGIGGYIGYEGASEFVNRNPERFGYKKDDEDQKYPPFLSIDHLPP